MNLIWAGWNKGKHKNNISDYKLYDPGSDRCLYPKLKAINEWKLSITTIINGSTNISALLVTLVPLVS